MSSWFAQPQDVNDGVLFGGVFVEHVLSFGVYIYVCIGVYVCVYPFEYKIQPPRLFPRTQQQLQQTCKHANKHKYHDKLTTNTILTTNCRSDDHYHYSNTFVRFVLCHHLNRAQKKVDK